jgi:hypothetical protein
MRKLILKLWKDDGGALIATEWVFVATILVIGTVVGLAAVRNAVASELTEFANAVMALNQGYTITELANCAAENEGSTAIDRTSNHINFRNSVNDGDENVSDINQNPCAF